MAPPLQRWDVIVVGAGVFGAWTAHHLQQAGKRVLLVEAWSPAHGRASSGGETRMIRAAYGADDIYSEWAWRSLDDWRRLSETERLPIFHQTGVLYFFQKAQPYLEDTMAALGRLGAPLDVLGQAELGARFPQIDWQGVQTALFEPELGVLMARRAVQTLIANFVRAGGDYRQAAIRPPADGDSLEMVETSDGSRLAADAFVFACGPWLPKVFPGVIGGRIFPTRQDIFFFAPPSGDDAFGPSRLPAWGDYNDGDLMYGFPDIEGRGFKIAHDLHGPPTDPDLGDRTPDPANLEIVRAYMRKRFPALAAQPLNEVRVCQYENSSNGDFLIDRHPQWSNVVLAGAGSGHGFKHGPMVGRAATELLTDPRAQPHPRFALAAKGLTQQRQVH
jgi:monomeric sarcosine oxidase